MISPDVHELDKVALDRYCKAHLADYRGALEVERIPGGASNPTYLVTAREGRDSIRYVLRKKPPGKLMPSAHQIEREYRIMAALRDTDVPVPNVRLLCTDASVLGTPFYIMDFLEGRIFRDYRLPSLTATERARIFDSANDILARLHRVDFGAIGLGDLGRPGNYFERQIARFSRQYRDAETARIAAMDELIERLPALIPDERSVAIAHGDFRLENIMFHPTEPRAVALLDWELCTVGNPLGDLAYSCICYNADVPWFGTLAGADLAALGIPSEADYIAAYCARVGRADVRNWNFYLAFSVFRLAAIAQGVYRRALDGIGTGHEAGAVNETQRIAAIALALLERP